MSHHGRDGPADLGRLSPLGSLAGPQGDRPIRFFVDERPELTLEFRLPVSAFRLALAAEGAREEPDFLRLDGPLEEAPAAGGALDRQSGAMFQVGGSLSGSGTIGGALVEPTGTSADGQRADQGDVPLALSAGAEAGVAGAAGTTGGTDGSAVVELGAEDALWSSTQSSALPASVAAAAGRTAPAPAKQAWTEAPASTLAMPVASVGGSGGTRVPIVIGTWDEDEEAEEVAAEGAAAGQSHAQAVEESYAETKGDAWSEGDEPDDDYVPNDDGPVGDPTLPLLIFNLSKFLEDLPEGVEVDAVVDNVRTILYSDFANMSEQLFSAGMCYHSSTDLVDDDVERLQLSLGQGTMLHVFEYPERMNDKDVIHLWTLVTRMSDWACVDAIKFHLENCCRGLAWKAEVAAELENLARVIATERAEQLGAIQGRLTQLREARQQVSGKLRVLERSEQDAGVTAQISTLNAEMHEIETSIEDAMVAAKALQPTPGAIQGEEDAAIEGAERTVLDSILDLIFERIPKPFDRSTSGHSAWVAEQRRHLRRQWIEEVGRLPRPVATEVTDD